MCSQAIDEDDVTSWTNSTDNNSAYIVISKATNRNHSTNDIINTHHNGIFPVDLCCVLCFAKNLQSDMID